MPVSSCLCGSDLSPSLRAGSTTRVTIQDDHDPQDGQDSGERPASESVPLADRGWYLAIEFRQSSSANFERAVKAASKHPGFALLLDESGACVYRVLARSDQLESVGRLTGIVRGWKTTRYYVCGAETTAEGIDYWLACYLQRRKEASPACRKALRAANPAQPVGCPWAGLSLAMSDYDSWYRRGRFDRDGAFQISKEYLIARVESWERPYGGCPYADAALLRRVVDLLPEFIDPRSDRRWRVVRTYYGESMVALAPAGRESYADFLREHLAPLLR